MHIKSFTAIIRRLIQYHVLAICLCLSHNSYGLGVKYLSNEWAGFVYYLSQDAPFVSLVRNLCFRRYSFPEELTQFRNSYVTLEEEQFFSELVRLKSMDEIETVLDSIEDATQREMGKQTSRHVKELF